MKALPLFALLLCLSVAASCQHPQPEPESLEKATPSSSEFKGSSKDMSSSEEVSIEYVPSEVGDKESVEEGAPFEVILLAGEALTFWLEEGALLAQIAGNEEVTKVTELHWSHFDAVQTPNDEGIIIGVLKDGSVVMLTISPSMKSPHLDALTRLSSPEARWVRVVLSDSPAPQKNLFALIGGAKDPHENLLLPAQVGGIVGPASVALSCPSKPEGWESFPYDGGVIGASVGFGSHITFFGLPNETPLYHQDYPLTSPYQSEAHLKSDVRRMGFLPLDKRPGEWLLWTLGEETMEVFAESWSIKSPPFSVEAKDVDLVATEDGFALMVLGDQGLELVDFSLTLEEAEPLQAVLGERRVIAPNAVGDSLECVVLSGNPLCAVLIPGQKRPVVFTEERHEPKIGVKEIFGTAPEKLTLEAPVTLCGMQPNEIAHELITRCCEDLSACEGFMESPDIVQSVLLQNEFCERSLRSINKCEFEPMSVALDEEFVLSTMNGISLRFTQGASGWRFAEAIQHEPAFVMCGTEAFKPFEEATQRHCQGEADLHCQLLLRSLDRCQKLDSVLDPDSGDALEESDFIEEIDDLWLRWNDEPLEGLYELRIREKRLVEHFFSYVDLREICAFNVRVTFYFDGEKWQVESIESVTAGCSA